MKDNATALDNIKDACNGKAASRSKLVFDLKLNYCVKITADDILRCLSYFSQNIELGISRKLSPKEIICM